MNNNHTTNKKKTIKAYTLIELMIYVALSAIVLSSAFSGISSFYHNNFSHRAMFSILENSRLLQDSINHEVKKAGYQYSPTRNSLNQYPQEFGFQKGESIILRNNKILFYRFYAEDNDDFITSFDCTGMNLSKERKLYYVRIRHIAGNQVTCRRFTRDAIFANPNALAALDPLSDPVVLASGIENLNFWAGIDEDDDGYIDRYLPGDKFQEKIRLGDVVALRYRFDVVASDQVAPSTNTDPDEMDFSQKMVRTPFDRIIYLRN
jgi:hypothetical protein